MSYTQQSPWRWSVLFFVIYCSPFPEITFIWKICIIWPVSSRVWFRWFPSFVFLVRAVQQANLPQSINTEPVPMVTLQHGDFFWLKWLKCHLSSAKTLITSFWKVTSACVVFTGSVGANPSGGITGTNQNHPERHQTNWHQPASRDMMSLSPSAHCLWTLAGNVLNPTAPRLLL